ncbi:hypothetical protein [Desulfovibrio ferrophilus]|uniref:Uncharacterized protein n=1 Tax=Desulfovibrio ferrophilus TaxID=241368 RepID=A0A2Z6AU76_9BACT|nr:hypothetical protein [Desulfovibrio ferrophilus]BBD06782.1 uncharacterized protein DFE_0056 [Desulfovibrio ferrophilus]
MKNTIGICWPAFSLFEKVTIATLLLISLLLLLPSGVMAEQSDAFATLSGNKTAPTKQLDPTGQSVVQAVQAILNAVDNPQAASPTEAMATLADIVTSDGPAELDLPTMDGAKGVALREQVASPLSRILEYAYNPDVPAYLVLPSVVRLSQWYPESDILNLQTPLHQQLPASATPLVLRGREYEEITPDTFSGGYYSYDLQRMLALFQHQGRNVLVSVSRQDGESEVGKKGVVLDDNKWNYFYSGKEGLTQGAIGWMDTYMYDSWSVSVFVEEPDGTTTNMIFKWLRAGWAGMNVVKGSHILEGCKRFARAFRSVIESDLLPAAGELAAKTKELLALSENELDRRIKHYARQMERVWKNHPVLSRRTFAKIMEGGGYAKALNREQRVSALLLEYLKKQLQTASIRQG